MPAFKVGTFLQLEGDALAVQANGQKLSVTGFTSARLTEPATSTDILIECSDGGPGPDDGKCRLKVDGFTGNHEAGQIDLKDGRDAKLTLRWPVPISPQSEGLWLFLVFRRAGSRYLLRFTSDDTGSGMYLRSRWNSNYVHLTFPSLGSRTPVGSPDSSFAEWVSALQGQWASNAIQDERTSRPGTSKFWIKSDVFKPESRTAVLLPVVGEIDPVAFSINFEPDHTEKAFRLALKLELVLKAGGARLASRAVFHTDQPEDPIGPLVPGPVTWMCRPFGPAQGPRWVLDWPGLPTDRGHAELNTNWLWGAMTRHYAVGLRSLRAPNSLSFVPGTLAEGKVKNPVRSWTLRFLIDVKDGSATSRLAELLPEPGELQLQLPNAGTTSNEPVLVDVFVKPSSDRSRGQIKPTDEFSFIDLVLSPATGSSDPYECLISGVLLSLGRAIDDPKNTRRKNTLRATVRAPAKRFAGQHSMDVEFRLTLKGALPRPASQDAERGFESENVWLQREPSVVWDLAGAPREAAIEIDETSSTKQSRRLQLRVRPPNHEGVTYRGDAVVIDLQPFLVSRVLAVSTAPRGEVFAAYRDDPDYPGGWEFQSNTGHVHLVLPPQAIGEEMIKGLYKVPDTTGALVDVPIADRVFDHRLSPPAQLLLDRTDVDTARALAPWSLRRLFDRRLGVVGARLLRARFELLYGLTSVLADEDPDNPLWLRLAESDALVGAIPLSSELRAVVLNAKRGLQGELTDYASNVEAWIRSLMRRPAQLPVYREWTARERLLIRDGLYFELRGTRQTAHPFRPHKLSVSPEGDTPTRQPMRGGVDWGFESPNIYDEFVKSGRARTNEERRKRDEFVPYGQIAGLQFGALGGSGGQKAIFSNGKTHVISETTQGRLDSLTIVRIGRIAMLWHHARHVIVYERSTRTAPRYRERPLDPGIADQQPSGFEGMAALRKVKEFIEVTQPRRAYPDYPTAMPTNACLGGVFFETTVIPVKSSWGRDVPGGWVMHLRGPMMQEEQPFYPEPKIFGELSRTTDKGGGHVSQLVEKIELLRFFTSTRRQDGADTDLWPAFPDIDLPLTARPKPPKVPFLPTFAGMGRQPDAEEADFGQRRFSLHMKPSTEAVNLMHGRPLKGLDARVRTVSMARGAPVLVGQLPAAIGKLQEKCADDRAVVVEGLAEIASRVALQASGGDASDAGALATAMRERLKEMSERMTGLRKAVENAEQKDALAKDPWESQQARLKTLAEQSAARLLDKLRDPEEEQPFWKRVWEASQGPEDAAQRIAQRIDAQHAELRNQILSQVSVAQVAVETFASARDRSRQFASQVATGAQAGWDASFAQVKTQFAAGAVVAADRAFRLALAELRVGVASARDQAARQVAGWLGSFGDVVLNDSAAGPAARLTNAVQGLCDLLLALIDDALEYTPPFEHGQPDWDALEKLVPDLTVLDEWFAEAERSVASVLASLETHWTSLRKKALAELDNSIREVKARIKRDLAAALGGDEALREKLAREMNALWAEGAMQMKVVTDRLGDALPGELANLGMLQDLKTTLDSVLTQLGSLADVVDQLPMADVEQMVQSVVRDAEAALGHLADRVEREVVGALVDTVEGAVQPALEVTRAFAEGLVTDTIHCSRKWLGYYFDPNQLAVDVTRASAVFNQTGQDALNSLSAQMPFDRIRDRMMAQLADFDVNKLFPNFAGLKLEHLLGDLKVPPDPLAEYEWIKVKHGFDKNRLTAWADVSIDKKFDGETEVFDLSPVSLFVQEPHFSGHSRIGSPDGSAGAQSTKAFLKADWSVRVNNEPVMTIERATLSFDESGKLDFDFSPSDVRLAPALEFITDALKALLPPDSGLTLLPVVPGGVRTELSLPLPDIGTGAFTMTGITLNTYFELQVANGFEVSTGLWLSKPDRPFGLAILFLGGGGWFGVDVRYRPPGTFVTRVSVGISAGAFIALNLSVIRGSAGLLFTAGLDYYRDSSKGGGGDLVVTVGILMWGEFSILSFVSAYLRLVMRVEYRNGSMTSYGRVSVSIKICWCYTFRCNRPVSMPFGSGGRKLSAPATRLAAASTAVPTTTPRQRMATAVRSHLDSLSWS
jgi:hypothetical protein